MHFKNLFPNVEIGFKPLEFPGLRKSRYRTPYWFCGNQTRWYDDYNGNYVCSVRCLEYSKERNKK